MWRPPECRCWCSAPHWHTNLIITVTCELYGKKLYYHTGQGRHEASHIAVLMSLKYFPIISPKISIYQVLSQGSAPLSYLIGQINHYVTCKFNATTDKGCQSSPSPPNRQQSDDLGYRTFDDIKIDLSPILYPKKRYAWGMAKLL